MKRLLSFGLALCLGVLPLTSLVHGQDSRRGAWDQSRGPGGPGLRGGQLVGISVGDTLPDVRGIDEKGQAVNLRDLLHNQYGVIVFGCLT